MQSLSRLASPRLASPRLALAAALSVATLSAQAGLVARPGGMVYDTVQTDAASSPVVALTGTAVAPAARVSVSTMTFAGHRVGTASPAMPRHAAVDGA